jgi:putative ABC transport system permease protein
VNLTSASAEQVMIDLGRNFPSLRLQLQKELRRTALATFDQTFAITTVLIVIAMIVAGIGVYVAVTTLRLNKLAGSKLLVGMGVSRFESVGMDFALGLGIGLIAMLLAVPLGAAFGWILCSVINPRAFGWTVQLQFSLQAVAMPVVWGLVAAACAGLIRLGRQEEGAGGVSH